MELQDVKNYLRVDGTDNDSIITAQMEAAQAELALRTKNYSFTDDKLANLYICERVKSLYFSDYDNSEMQKLLLQLLIDKADGIV